MLRVLIRRGLSESVPPIVPTDVDSLKGELDETKKKLLYAYADQENLRKQVRKEIEQNKLFSVRQISKELLDVVDNLDLIEAHISKIPPPMSKENDLVSLREGISMTKSQFLSVLGKYGTKRIETKPGDDFDPKIHSALCEVESPDIPTGKVASVLKHGYTMHTAVLRDASVAVAKKKD